MFLSYAFSFLEKSTAYNHYIPPSQTFLLRVGWPLPCPPIYSSSTPLSICSGKPVKSALRAVKRRMFDKLAWLLLTLVSSTVICFHCCQLERSKERVSVALEGQRSWRSRLASSTVYSSLFAITALKYSKAFLSSATQAEKRDSTFHTVWVNFSALSVFLHR